MAVKTLSTTAEELLPQSGLRRSFIVQNEDASINVFIKKERPGNTTVSSTDHDHRLGPSNHISLNYETDGEEAIRDRWTIVAASGTPLVSYFETENIKR